MSTSFLSFDNEYPTLRPRFVDPLKSVAISPSSQYVPTLDPGSFTSNNCSPRLLRTTTPRRVSNSPSASQASPRMPRYGIVATDAPPALMNPGGPGANQGYRSTPTIASSQGFSSSSAYSMSSMSLSASRFGTPVRSVMSTPVRGMLGTSPASLRPSSRPSSPAPTTRAPRARSPILTLGSVGIASSPLPTSSLYPQTPTARVNMDLASPSATSSPRHFLRDLAATWRCRGSENQQSFREGGYMNANPGDVLQSRYELIVKLGWGEFSTVWLAFDRKASSIHRTFVAVKIAKCSADVIRGTKYECCLLAYVRERVHRSAPVACLLDCFEAKGKFGDHLCMSMPLLGSNMLCVIEQFKARGRRRRSDKELQLVKEVSAAILKALAHLENANVLHTDLKPENVLVSAPDVKVCRSITQFCKARGVLADNDQLQQLEEGDPRGPIATLADFGLSLLLEPITNADPIVQRVTSRKEMLNIPKAGLLKNDRGMLIQTREYRAPEVLFGADFNCRTDVWSLGCMAYEMITGDFLMDPKQKTRVEKDMDVEHVAMMMQILGPVPSRITTGNGKHLRKFFDPQGQFQFAAKYSAYPRRSIAVELETFLEPSEAERAAQFIMSCFTYDPAERCHANDLLRHSWLRSLQL